MDFLAEHITLITQQLTEIQYLQQPKQWHIWFQWWATMSLSISSQTISIRQKLSKMEYFWWFNKPIQTTDVSTPQWCTFYLQVKSVRLQKILLTYQVYTIQTMPIPILEILCHGPNINKYVSNSLLPHIFHF